MIQLQNKQSLKIAMFCVHSHPLGCLGTTDTGGMSVYICQVALELGKRGHCVDIFTRFNGLYHEKVLELSKNVRLIHVKAGKSRPLDQSALYFHLGEFIKGVESFRVQTGVNYDVIHSHYWLSGLVGLWAQSHWSKPHAITFHTVSAVKEKVSPVFNDPKIRLINEKEIVKNCDLIVSLTALEKQEIIQLYAGQPSKISVIQCGVDLDRFCPVDKKKARKALRLSGDGMILLYVGRIDPMKGLDRLLAATALLRQKVCCKLLIVGGDDSPSQEQNRLIETTRNLDIEKCVVFSGSLPQRKLPLYYSAADVFVFPSRYESFGLAGLESLACGTPVVATDVGAYSQILIDRFTGALVFDPHPESFVKKIEEVLARSRKNHNQADKIRNTVKQYTWDRVAISLYSEYRNLIQSKSTKLDSVQQVPIKGKPFQLQVPI